MCSERHSGGKRGSVGGARLYDPAPLMAEVAHLSIAKAAVWLGVSTRQVVRYRSGRTWLRLNTADRLALAVNRMPIELWEDFGEPCCEANDPVKMQDRRNAYMREWKRVKQDAEA